MQNRNSKNGAANKGLIIHNYISFIRFLRLGQQYPLNRGEPSCRALALHTALTFPQRLAGAACLAGYLPLPHLYPGAIAAPNASLPVLLEHGTSDFVVPLAFAKRRLLPLLAGRPSATWATSSPTQRSWPCKDGSWTRSTKRKLRRENSDTCKPPTLLIHRLCCKLPKTMASATFQL